MVIVSHGVGTELWKLLSWLGFSESDNCKCNKFRRFLNKRGVKWCENNKQLITKWIGKQAKKRGLPFSRTLFAPLLNTAIKRSYKMSINETFERVYCVSLRRRPDRWARFVGNLPKDWPFADVVKFDAIDGRLCNAPTWFGNNNNSAWGCYRSHLAIIEKCINEQVNSVLLLEDDALFTDGFTANCLKFLSNVPNDWQMLYLGGQHLQVAGHPPIKVNAEVYTPYNVNRTHAFALRGEGLVRVYKHLMAKDWGTVPKHIDHRLGALHSKRDMPIYCPRQWLVGQAEGKSDISGRNPPNRVWQAAEKIVETPLDEIPFIAVMGLHSSGSSCLAGVLYHLGVFLGDKLGGYYGSKPGESCGYEAQGLANICEKALPFPAVGLRMPPNKLKNKLQAWISSKKRQAYGLKAAATVAAGKYPMLCAMGKQLQSACSNLAVISIDREVEKSIASIVKRCPKKDPAKLRAHQLWLEENKSTFLTTLKPSRKFRVKYDELLKNTAAVVDEIVKFIQTLNKNFNPSKSQIEAAVKSISADKQHVK